MTPFNLEEYLDDPSRKIVTREGGGEARIIRVDVDDSPYPILASVDMRIKKKKVKSLCYENLRNTHIKF